MENIKDIITTIDFIVWGYISMKIWEFITPQKEMKVSEKYIEMLIIGLGINKISKPVVMLIPVWKIVFSVILPFVLSLVLPFILRKIFEINCVKSRMIKTITPLAWDFYFSKAKPSYIKVHFKDKDREPVVGWFGTSSFASSYPNSQDIYIEGIYTTHGKKLTGIKKNTMGILIKGEEILSIEFIEKNQNGGSNG